MAKPPEIPGKFIDRIKRQFPSSYERMLQSLSAEAETTIQINRLKNESLAPEGESLAWYASGRILSERPFFAADPAWHSGSYYVQEAASMFMGSVLDEQLAQVEQPLVLDLCAAPGGKSLLALNALNGSGILWSNEVHPGRAKVLRDNLLRYGHGNVVLSSESPESLSSSGLEFDAVIVDAPCSGEGMFRKDPESRREWYPKAPSVCAARQRMIMDSASKLVREGGILIYSTCTFSAEENEEQMARLVNSGLWESVECNYQSAWGILGVNVEGVKACRFLPGETIAGEGFFIAVIRKLKAERGMFRAPIDRKVQKADGRKAALARDYVGKDSTGTIFSDSSDGLHWLTDDMERMVRRIPERMKLYLTGTPVGHLKGPDLVPDHAMALSLCLSDQVPAVELDLDSAREYLRGKDPGREKFSSRGWQLVSWNGQPLGWISAVGGRINNYYPRMSRLRAI